MKALIRSVLDTVFSAAPGYRKKLTNYFMTEKLRSALQQLQSEGMAIHVVYDIGARHGAWAQSLKRSLPNADFFLFEANEKCAPILSARGFQHFIGVLSSDVREVEFYDANGTGDSYYKENTPSYDSVTATTRTTKTLDSIVSSERLPPADLIKIDTQGSELDVLRGGQKSLQGCSLVYLECPTLSYNHGAPNFQEYCEFLLGHSFVPCEVCELHYSYGALVQMDVLFVRKEHLKKVNARFASVPHFLG